MKRILYNATVYKHAESSANGRFELLEQAAVKVEDGKITDIIRDESTLSLAQYQDYERIDAGGLKLVPGFIDVHIHGGGGYDVMKGEVEHILGVSRFHAAHGTTAFLPTTLTADRESIERAVRSIAAAAEQGTDGAEIVGIHLEGPFISPKRCGAQHPDHVRTASVEELSAYIEMSQGRVRLITVAPEEPKAMELIRYAVKQGITVSIGHSDATLEVIREAVNCGATHVTHLFNGMRPLHHREPGTAGGALLLDELTVELISDGFHVHPDLIHYVYRVKPSGKIVLVTDAMTAAGLPDGDDYELGGLPCYKKDGQVRLKSSHDLAGSCLTLDAALRNTIQFTGRPIEDVLPSLTLNPARQIGLDKVKGSIQIGKDADFVLLNEKLEVAATYVKGKPVYGG